MTLNQEADRICRYLTGRRVSPGLAERYMRGLAAIGETEALGRIHASCIPASSGRLSPQSRKAHVRLMLMAALLETDPGYNRLFFNPGSRILAHLAFLAAGISGFGRYLFNKISCR